MTTPNITSSTDSQMHNNIMTAGEALRKCILSGPYKPTTVLVQAVDATDDSLAVPEHATVETPMNMSLENKARFLAEKEAIHLILTGIGDDIYSTVDACQTAQEMWEAIERHKGKKIAKPIIPSSETASEEDSDPEQAQRDNDMQLKLALIAKYFKKIYKPTNNNLRTSSNSKNKNVDTTLQYKNDDHYGQFGNQRTIIVAAARENVGSKVVQQSGIQCFNCREFGHFVKECRKPKRLADMDEEVDEQELEAHYSYMANIQEVPTADSGTDSEPVEQVQNKAGYNVFANHLQHSEQSESVSNTCLLEKDDSNVIPDSPDMCEDDIQNEQSDVESNDERVALVNLIANLKLDVDENKKIQKQLKKANTTLAQELKECKVILAKTSKSLRESISVRDSCLVALQTKQAEFEKYKAFNDRTIDYDKRERMLNEALGQLAQKDTVIREGLKTKAYEISVVKEKHDELMKQSLLTKSHYEGLVKKKMKAQFEIPCLYTFPYDQNTHANRLILDGEETLALERESRSKLNKDLVRPYDYTTLNRLYEIFKPPTQEYETLLAHANKIRRKMWRKYFVKSKPNIYKNIGFLPVSQSISKSRQAYNVMTNNINHFKEIVDNAWIKHSKDQFHALTAQYMEILIQTYLMPLAIKTQNDSLKFFHELKQEMHADLKYVENLKKEIDELESDKAEFSYMYDEILQECVSKDVRCSYLQSLSNLDALAELQCMYLHKVEKHSISLENALQKCKEQVKNDTFCNEKASNVFRKEREQYFKILDLKAQLQDKNIAISELKKLIEKGKGKSMDTKFDRPIYFQKTKLVPKANVSEGLSKPVTAQTLPQTVNKAVSNTNVLKPGLYRIDNRTTQTRAPQLPQTVRNTNPRVSTSTGVNHKPTVSRPQLKCNQSRDKVPPNNSQVKFKKTQVEVHPRIPSVSNKIKSVTACKDILNSRTLNANAVCATCNKCLVDSNHFACVTKMLNDVHARTKKPNVVHISTRKPKSQANKSIATPNKKKVASKSTDQKPQSYFRVLYENTSKAWKWWIERLNPSGYKWVPKPKRQWVPKAKMQWVPKAKIENVQKRVSFAIDNTSRITNVLKCTNYLGSDLSTIPSSSNSLADYTTHPIHC
nr:hypothetical protein [Tanacetum cinerariifolium]